jgi:hypothetical protein
MKRYLPKDVLNEISMKFWRELNGKDYNVHLIRIEL